MIDLVKFSALRIEAILYILVSVRNNVNVLNEDSDRSKKCSSKDSDKIVLDNIIEYE